MDRGSQHMIERVSPVVQAIPTDGRHPMPASSWRAPNHSCTSRTLARQGRPPECRADRDCAGIATERATGSAAEA